MISEKENLVLVNKAWTKEKEKTSWFVRNGCRSNESNISIINREVCLDGVYSVKCKMHKKIKTNTYKSWVVVQIVFKSQGRKHEVYNVSTK